ncbi:sensor histidine kinase [Paractinoplanes globisporus]|uniref:histidine kinase n=1 Tax=Paractinoplanes globisporus TaxID=113565 RepID=A0ABW6WXY1_9ACTN|nr:HAMP domain-containing sensor histidine kinase [Actinoplanes globisporus]
MTAPDRTAWWSRRTLHARLAFLVGATVALALVAFAIASWVAVRELQEHRINSQLNADAMAISQAPGQWAANRAALPDPGYPVGRPGRGPHRGELGPRWQIVNAAGGVVSSPDSPLPVTALGKEAASGVTHRHPVQEQVTIGGDTYQMLTMPLAGGGAVQVAISEDESRRTLAVLALLLAAGCVIGIAGAAFAGRAVARAGLVPVERLTGAVEEVAATTDLTHPIEVTGDDEIARLGRSVNTMLAAIDSSRRAQRALVEDAGHELRTPLTSIRTNVELLLTVERHPELAHRLPPEERAKLLSDLDAQVRELATLTTELVELAREDTTREDPEPVELGDIVTAAINRVRIRAPGLTFEATLSPVTVTGRPGELERMVVNVLDNAAKWSPPGAAVAVALTPDGVLTVSDSGPGIAPDDLPHVFDRFYRAAAARSMPGSGLGLAIVAQTAAQHGGTVTAGPNSPHGTTVTIRLPVTDHPAGAGPS